MSAAAPHAPVAPLDIVVRTPSATAWLFAAIGVVGAGETFSEIQKGGVGRLFGWPLQEGELWSVFAVAAVVGGLAIAYLLLVALRPGRVHIDPTTGELTRFRPRGPFSAPIAGPLSAWRVRMVFFSEREQQRGAFKRLELATEDFREVLLYGDFRKPQALVDGLTACAGELAALEIELQRPASDTNAAV